MNNKISIEDIGKYISDRRKALNMTQEQLASKLEVSNRIVSNWEKGRTAPDILLLKPLATILKVDVNELLEANNTKNKARKRNIKWFDIVLVVIMAICLGIISSKVLFEERKEEEIYSINNVISADNNYYLNGKMIRKKDRLTFVISEIAVLNNITYGTDKEAKTKNLNICFNNKEGNFYNYSADYNGNEKLLSSALEGVFIVFDTDSKLDLDNIEIVITYNKNERITIPIKILEI